MLSALKHTLWVTLFVLLFTFVMTSVLHVVGEDRLAELILNRPVIANVLSAAVGLIPNSASSVVLTELHLSGILSVGAMLSGLLVGAGVGLLVLFRVNDKLKNSIFILVSLFLAGTFFGIIFDLLGLGAIIGI